MKKKQEKKVWKWTKRIIILIIVIWGLYNLGVIFEDRERCFKEIAEEWCKEKELTLLKFNDEYFYCGGFRESIKEDNKYMFTEEEISRCKYG